MTFSDCSASERTNGHDDRVTTRLLPSCGSAPALEFLEIKPGGETLGAPILCLHGAFDGAWMWREKFFCCIARPRRAAPAPTVWGSGKSGGRPRPLPPALTGLRTQHLIAP